MSPRIPLVAFLLFSLIMTSVPVVFGAHIHQFSWGSSAYYPGDQASFHMTLFNDYPGSVFVKEIQMQWDWQSSGRYYTAPGGQTLIPIQTVDYVITFTVPLNVTFGKHVWTVYYVDANDRQVFVGQGAFKIHDPEERAYLDLQAGVQANLTKARSTAFGDPNATSLAFVANAVYNNATDLADQGDFVSAISTLRNASTLIARAFSEEAAFQNLKNTYLSDLSQINVALGKGESSNFQSGNATGYLNQAVILHDHAAFLASGMKYATADMLLKNVSSLIDQANLAEQTYLGEGQTTSTTSTQTRSSSNSTPSQTATSSSSTIRSSTSTGAPVQQTDSLPVTIAIGGLIGFVLLASIFILLLRRRG